MTRSIFVSLLVRRRQIAALRQKAFAQGVTQYNVVACCPGNYKAMLLLYFVLFMLCHQYRSM